VRWGAGARAFERTSLGVVRGWGMSCSASPFSVATAAFIPFSVGCFVQCLDGRKRGLLCPGRGLSRVRRPPVGSAPSPQVLRAQVGAAVYMRARPRVLSSGQDAVGGPLPWRPTRTERTKPPFRAEHLGILFPPPPPLH